MMIYVVACGFILLDIATGLLKGLNQKNLNSTILREGLYHKIAELVAIVGSSFLEYSMQYVDLGVGNNLPIVNTVCIYIIIMEVVSCIENICIVNPQLSKLFSPYLEKLKGQTNEN